MVHNLHALGVFGEDERVLSARAFPAPASDDRTAFERDRDRVVQARAFRRLAGKTQVFTSRASDHFRSRLTHTMGVAQVARHVASALNLNVDLTETLALVHDIGHPPFGHAGERKLDELMRPHGGGFDHNLHALHIVEQFEQRYLDFLGLNLTFEVREGIIKHSRDYDPAQFPELSEYRLDERPPLEAQLIDFVDEIAYNTADLDDGYEAKLLDIELISSQAPLFAEFYEEVERGHAEGIEKLKFNESVKLIIDYLATDLIENTRAEAAASGANSVEDVRRLPRRLAGFSPQAATENAALKKFLLERLYNQPAIVMDRERSVEALEQLFKFYLEHPEAMPKSYAGLAQREPRHRVVCDYIAGMTDHFLLRQHQELLGASSAPAGR